MAQPAPYVREYDFEGFQSGHPNTPLPGNKVNSELDGVAAVVDEVLERIAILQRDDLELANESVGYDQLKPEVIIGFNPPTQWLPGTSYSARDTVFNEGIMYITDTAHTSSATFATDLALGYWEELADMAGSIISVINETFQQLSSDLTEIAALTTTAFGRSLLELADAAALAAILNLEAGTDFLSPAAIAAAYQPLDDDLTSIAALTTTAFGRGLLELADAAALKTVVGAGAAVEVLDEGVSETSTLLSLDFVGAGVTAADDGSGNVTVTISGGGGGGAGLYDANWFDVTAAPYNATGDGVTDDTAAIQAAIDACEAAGGGTVYFPRGVYVVNGALQDTSRSNAQLLLPRRDYVDTEAITIVLRGEAPPPSVVSVIGATSLPDNLSVIKGTLNTASGTAPCLIGAHGPVGTSGDFSNVLVALRDLTIEMPDNPQLTAVDCSRVAQFDADGLLIHTGEFFVDDITTPTTSTSFGLRTPGNNNGAMTRMGIVNVVGFYKGFEIGEHCVGQDVSAWGCLQGFVFVAANHASMFTRIMTVHCVRGLVFTGGAHATHISEFNIEHVSAGSFVTTYDVDDASNFARGALYWHVVLGGTGIDNTFLVNGAKYLKRAHLNHEGGVYSLTDGATVTVDCNVASNFRWNLTGNRTFANPTAPYDGQVINVRVIQDGTGGRTWSLGTKFKFPGGSPVLSTAASAKDFISCQYDAADDTWFCSIMKALS